MLQWSADGPVDSTAHAVCRGSGAGFSPTKIALSGEPFPMGKTLENVFGQLRAGGDP